ncbi:nitrogen assimilation transcription factor nirA [Niveomyces insectorum RCEF 264]|uniref:Nitrogen assimilation transcription factor nirA n=1 Tax=Niveomyces insectorum RCEF 264 TaxID=1081102 RepID=A0A167RB46_9HYPO|nr:nitrogen assimilation transcription factor nirA [Niveomyces insectorum RCEF 264]
MESSDAACSPSHRTSKGPGGNTSRKYGFSCLACRRRKVRCSGERPACRGCARSGVECVYRPQNPSVARLSTALERSEARIAELQEALRGAETLNALSCRAHSQSQESDLHESPERAESETASKTSLSIDESGAVQYYGATSRFHQPPPADGQHPLAPKLVIDEAYHRRWLLSNARFQVSWDRAVLANLHSLSSGEIDADAASTLLRIYWTWQAPLHSCVYRRCFTRDMALGGEGPYFSPFLLNVIFAHACRHAKPGDSRFVQYEKGEVFLSRAKMLLLEAMEEEKPRIPTIQGLLLLGGRQCAVGKNAQGWLYTGMAIRMLKHLCFHLPKYRNSLLERLEPDDLEAQKRLCLSAYAWDKSISLCLGRPPSFPDMPYSPTSLLDTSDDADLWYPFYLSDDDGGDGYQPTPSYNTTTFMYFCQQAKIINEMYDTVYNRRSEHIDHDTVVCLETKFRSFYRSLPDQIRVDDVESLPSCPPPHIFSLNILYHTSLILLYRPFFRLATTKPPDTTGGGNDALLRRAHRVCTEEAASVNAFFRAYGRTYWFCYQTYLTSYCVYTAATVEVQQVRHPDRTVSSQAVERLATTLRMLEAESQQTPGIRRSVDIIKAQLNEPRRDGGNVMVSIGPSVAAGVDEATGPQDGRAVMAQHSSTVPIRSPAVVTAATVTPASIQALVNPHEGSLGPTPLLGPVTVADLGTNLPENSLLSSTWLDWYDVPNAGGRFVPDLDDWDTTGL